MSFSNEHTSDPFLSGDMQAGQEARTSKEEAKRLSAKISECEAEKAAVERQAQSDADVMAERVRAAGQRITELQGKT